MATLLLLSTVAGCRTRLLDSVSPGSPAPTDAASADLTQLVDAALPRGDLALPFTCRNIFVIDGDTRMLSSFDPQSATFADIGRVRCPSNSAPSSMAIARTGDIAWMTFQDGNLFKVSTLDARCERTAYQEQFSLDGSVGMSFSADTPGGQSETLFVGGGRDLVLVARDLATMMDRRIGPLPSFLELGGTSAAELFGFFPAGIGGPDAVVAAISKVDASLGRVIPLRGLPANFGNFTFAFWGGSFWIFEEPDGSTAVFRVDGQSGALSTVKTNTGRHIIGASTSSCAPVGLDS